MLAQGRYVDRFAVQKALTKLAVMDQQEPGLRAVLDAFGDHLAEGQHRGQTWVGHAAHHHGMTEAGGFRRVFNQFPQGEDFRTNGDQGFLMCRSYFKELGGFNTDLPFLEDQDLAERIRSDGRWVTLPGVLQTSARRFETEGFHRRYILMAIMMGWATIIIPAVWGDSPLMYCRYKLSKKPTAKVAL